jgi:hypothetical protein
MRRIASVPSGTYHSGHGRVVCFDSDHDSLPEMYFRNHDSACHQIWESQGWNRFNLVFEDTAFQLPFIRARTAIPFAAGDIDGDGFADVVCITTERDSCDPGIFYDDVIIIESPDSFSYPCSLSWYYRYDRNASIPIPTYYPPDLDKDGHKEVFCAIPSIWENAGNNENYLVWHDGGHDGYRLTFGVTPV